MAQRQMDKVVATQLLEAIKSVLEHVSQWMIELTETGQDAPSGLSQLYGKVRRLRDYVHRGVAAYGKSVALDLCEEDQNLLVSCIVHHIGDIDQQLERGASGDVAWMEEKRRNLSQFAVALATRPVSRIPNRATVQFTTASVRSVTAAIAQRTVRLPGQPPASHAGPARQRWQQSDPAPLHPGEAPAPSSYAPPLQPSYPQAFGYGAPPAERPPQPVPPDYGYVAAGPFEDSSPGLFLDPDDGLSPSPDPGAFESLLDPQKVSDPRLRTMVAMDVRAFARTMASEDYRLAMVHLGSVFEAVIVDYVTPRHRDLNIRGTPETWRIEKILSVVLGDRLTSMDRPYLLQLVAARHLVRPAIQLLSPMVVTREILLKAFEFFRRVLIELGYSGSASHDLSGSPGASPSPLGAAPGLAPGLGATREGSPGYP